MQEYEIKFLEIDTEALIHTLEQIGAKWRYDSIIEANFFIDEKGNKVRLRKSEHENTLTYKIRSQQSWILHNDEYEVTFSDYPTMCRLFLALGFVRYGYSRKRRIEYEHLWVHYEIDTYDDIPSYLEIEAESPSDLRNAVERIGFDFDHGVAINERELRARYGKIPDDLPPLDLGPHIS